MAKIIYALSGEGRGHTSRVVAVTEELRRRGHEVVLCCGGTAQQILEASGERIIPVPALRQVIEGNRVRLGKTMQANWRALLKQPRIVSRLTDEFAVHKADLLITDFEAFSPKAAARIGLPILSFNHQQIVTETRYTVPPRYRLAAALTSAAIKSIVPKNSLHVLITSFFFPPRKRPERVTLVPPILRAAVQRLTPRKGEHVLVYYNQSAGAEHVIEALRRVDAASFIVYNFALPPRPERYPNITFKSVSSGGFLHDLAASRAVICTAGFTLMSEAHYFGKPLLVNPNRGTFEFEQTLNALFLEKADLGKAVIERQLTPQDVECFLADSSRLEAASAANRVKCGNNQAADCIEEIVAKIAAGRHASESK